MLPNVLWGEQHAVKSLPPIYGGFGEGNYHSITCYITLILDCALIVIWHVQCSADESICELLYSL